MLNIYNLFPEWKVNMLQNAMEFDIVSLILCKLPVMMQFSKLS